MQQKVHLHSIEGLVRISAVLGEAIADLSSRVSDLEQRLDWSAIEALLSVIPAASDLYADYSV